MDRKELNDYILKRVPKSLTPLQKQILDITNFYLGHSVDELCKKIELMPKHNDVSKAIIHGIIIAVIESATENTDEMLQMFNDARKSVIRIETDFNKD